MEEHLDIWIKISQQIGELNASIKTTLEKIANHEGRITKLETVKENDWKVTLLMLLAKAVVIGGVALTAVVGGGSLLSKILGIG